MSNLKFSLFLPLTTFRFHFLSLFLFFILSFLVLIYSAKRTSEQLLKVRASIIFQFCLPTTCLTTQFFLNFCHHNKIMKKICVFLYSLFTLIIFFLYLQTFLVVRPSSMLSQLVSVVFCLIIYVWVVPYEYIMISYCLFWLNVLSNHFCLISWIVPCFAI